jgi:hypothetical protein
MGPGCDRGEGAHGVQGGKGAQVDLGKPGVIDQVTEYFPLGQESGRLLPLPRRRSHQRLPQRIHDLNRVTGIVDPSA